MSKFVEAKRRALYARIFGRKSTSNGLQGAYLALAFTNAIYKDWEDNKVPREHRDYDQIRSVLNGSLKKTKELNELATMRAQQRQSIDAAPYINILGGLLKRPISPGLKLILTESINYAIRQWNEAKHAEAIRSAQDSVAWQYNSTKKQSDTFVTEALGYAASDSKYAEIVDSALIPIVGVSIKASNEELLESDSELKILLELDSVKALLRSSADDTDDIKIDLEKVIKDISEILGKLDAVAGSLVEKAIQEGASVESALKNAALQAEREKNDLFIGLQLLATIARQTDPKVARVLEAAIELYSSATAAYAAYGATLSAFGAYALVAIALINFISIVSDNSSEQNPLSTISEQIVELSQQVESLSRHLDIRIDAIESQLTNINNLIQDVLAEIIENKAISIEALRRLQIFQSDYYYAELSDLRNLDAILQLPFKLTAEKCIFSKYETKIGLDTEYVIRDCIIPMAYWADTLSQQNGMRLQITSEHQLHHLFRDFRQQPLSERFDRLNAALRFVANDDNPLNLWAQDTANLATWVAGSQSLAATVEAWPQQVKEGGLDRSIFDRIKAVGNNISQETIEKSRLFFSSIGSGAILKRYIACVHELTDFRIGLMNRRLKSIGEQIVIRKTADGMPFIGGNFLDGITNSLTSIKSVGYPAVRVSTVNHSPDHDSSKYFPPNEKLHISGGFGFLFPPEICALHRTNKLQIHCSRTIHIWCLPNTEKFTLTTGGWIYENGAHSEFLDEGILRGGKVDLTQGFVKLPDIMSEQPLHLKEYAELVKVAAPSKQELNLYFFCSFFVECLDMALASRIIDESNKKSWENLNLAGKESAFKGIFNVGDVVFSIPMKEALGFEIPDFPPELTIQNYKPEFTEELRREFNRRRELHIHRSNSRALEEIVKNLPKIFELGLKKFRHLRDASPYLIRSDLSLLTTICKTSSAELIEISLKHSIEQVLSEDEQLKQNEIIENINAWRHFYVCVFEFFAWNELFGNTRLTDAFHAAIELPDGNTLVNDFDISLAEHFEVTDLYDLINPSFVETYKEPINKLYKSINLIDHDERDTSAISEILTKTRLQIDVAEAAALGDQ